MINHRDNIDDLFREGLDGYSAEPSPGTWANIESHFFPPSGRKHTILITSIIIALLAGSALITWFTIPRGGHPETASSIAISTLAAETIEMTSQINETSSGKITSSSESIHKNIEMTSQTAEMTSQENSSPASSSKKIGLTPAHSYSFSEENQRASAFESTGEQRKNIFPDRMGPDYHCELIQSNPLMPLALDGRPFSIKMPLHKGLKNEYARRYEWALGASFMPSMIFYNPNPNNRAWSAGIDLWYSRSRFNIYAGAGLSRFHDKGSWEIQYQSYDSVGYFMNVTSFRVDPDSPGEVIFETQRKTVYDSVPHIVIEEKTNTYTYLDIPVGIGFTVLEMKRITITMKAGVMVSFKVHQDEPTVDYSAAGIDDFTVLRQVPARQYTTWRFRGGLEASYLLTSRLSLHLEPVFEQYLQSVYVSAPGYEAGKPYLIGVNAGVRYRLK